MKQEVDSKKASGYYLAVKNQTTLPFEQIKSQVKQLLSSAEVEQAREKYADSLRDKTEVAILLHNGEFLSTVRSEADLTVMSDRQLSGLARKSSTQALR